MTLQRARIVKGPIAPAERTQRLAPVIVPKAVVDAKAEAARIVAEAKAMAAAIEQAARDGAAAHASAVAEEARQTAIAKVAADVLHVRISLEKRLETELDRTVDLAKVIAERIIGEGLRLEPERIAAIAAEALKATRGARHIRIEACAADLASLRSMLTDPSIEVVENPDLGRGSLIVQTDLGKIDARLEPQLDHLAKALREALGS